MADLQTLNNGKSIPVIRPYSEKISSKWPLMTFLLNPDTTMTLYLPPPDVSLPASRRETFRGMGDLDLDLERDLDREG